MSGLELRRVLRALPEHFQKPGCGLQAEFLPHRHFWKERLTCGGCSWMSARALNYSINAHRAVLGPSGEMYNSHVTHLQPTAKHRVKKNSFYLRFMRTPRSEFGGIIALCCGLHSKGTPTSKDPITKLQTIIGGTTGSPNDTSALVTG